MWLGTKSQLQLIVWEWWPDFPLRETISAGSSENPQARPFLKMLS
jgi:hypothetical protein